MKTIDELCNDIPRGYGWIDLGCLIEFLQNCEVERIEYGNRENRTDGEAHWICRSADGKTFELKNANYYAAESWRPLLEWAEGKI